MAGRHSKRGAHARIAQRGSRSVGIVDAHSHVEHQVTDASATEHRHSGCYLALCGAWVHAASLTDPGRRQCAECAR